MTVRQVPVLGCEALHYLETGGDTYRFVDVPDTELEVIHVYASR